MKSPYRYSHGLLGLTLAAAAMTMIPATVAAALPAPGADDTQAAGGGQGETSGFVTDASTGLPLAGARVSVINSKVSAISDDAGRFSMTMPAAQVTLLAEAPGYSPAIVAWHKGATPVVRLSPAGALDFYDGVLTSDAAAHAMRFPMGQTVADRSVADLQGNLLSIQRSGMPGAGHQVYVQGLRSLNTSAQPLYVVDGVIWTTSDDALSTIDGHFNNPLALISPDDIESIYVMKNGQALYGARGGNGVVVIETRRARNEATEIEAYARLGWRGGIKSMPMMDASQYRLYASDIISGKYSNSNVIDRLSFLNDDKTSSQYAATHNNTDWLGLSTRNGLVMDYGVNVRGGDDRALYAFMLGYTKNDGALKETSFDRISIRFNSDINLWRGVTMRVDASYAQVNYKLRDDGINDLSSPYYLSLIKSPLYNPNVLTNDGKQTLKFADTDELGVGNPMSIFDLGIGENRNYRFTVNAMPRYEINEKIAVEGAVAYTFDKIKENSFLPDYGVAERQMINANNEVYFTANNTVENLMNRRTSFNASLQVAYNPLRDLVNDLRLHGGYRFMNDTYITSLGEGFNTSSDYINDLANTTLRETSGFDTQWRNMAWYVNGEYSLLQRYLLGVDLTLETSSRFGKKAPGALHMCGAAWGFFPSVDAAWLISSESWMQDVDAINLLKLRAGFDMAGNDNLPYFATRTYFDSRHFLGNAYGAVIANIGNDRLKWETTRTWQAGLDMSLFDDRWQWSLDLYRSTTSDLLVSKTLNEQSGSKSYWSNGGDLRNMGLNFSTTVRAVNTHDWRLDIGAAIGHYKNKVTALPDGDFTTDIAGGTILTAVGGPIGQFYGYRTEGVFSTTADAEAANLSKRNDNGSYSQFGAGDMHFADLHKDGVINDADRTVIGDPNPDIYGNVNFRLSWRNITLSSMFTYSVGNDVYNALRANLESGSDIYNQTTAMLGRWVANGQQTDVPRATYGDPMGNARFSDRWIEDGSYLKWKSLAIDYRIPISSPYIQAVTVSFAVNNLVTWTKYLGPDPEFSYGVSPLYMGVDAGLVPQAREFMFGVKINL